MSTVAAIEEMLADYQHLYETKQLTREEFLDLVKSLDTVNAIAETAEELYKKESLNTLINNVIDAASLVA